MTIVFHNGIAYEVPLDLVLRNDGSDIAYIEFLISQQSMLDNNGNVTWDYDDSEVVNHKVEVFTQEEINQIIQDDGQEKLLEQFECMLDGSMYGYWLPNEYDKPKKVCECGVDSIMKNSKPENHADYCPLYEKKK